MKKIIAENHERMSQAASILRLHPNMTVIADEEEAGLLKTV